MGFKLRDSIFAGLLPGLILPVLFLVAIILFRKAGNTFISYINAMYAMGLLSKVISICLIPNLVLFFGFLRFNRMRSARGVLLSMFVAAAVIGILKIL